MQNPIRFTCHANGPGIWLGEGAVLQALGGEELERPVVLEVEPLVAPVDGVGAESVGLSSEVVVHVSSVLGVDAGGPLAREDLKGGGQNVRSKCFSVIISHVIVGPLLVPLALYDLVVPEESEVVYQLPAGVAAVLHQGRVGGVVGRSPVVVAAVVGVDARVGRGVALDGYRISEFAINAHDTISLHSYFQRIVATRPGRGSPLCRCR